MDLVPSKIYILMSHQKKKKKKRGKGKPIFWHYLSQGRSSAISDFFFDLTVINSILINLQKANLGQEQESRSNL